MKKRIFLSIAFILVLAACKKEESKTTLPVSVETKAEAPKKECYSYDVNGNVVELQLEYNSDDVRGTLNYALAEKDTNMGTFIGKIENNFLLAEYTFQSEGTESTRQVAFKFMDGKLVEGYGEVNEDGTNFKDVTQLKFTSTMPLSKVDCTE